MIGDFILQGKSWVKAKERKKLKAYELYLHLLVHGGLIMLVVWDMTFLPWAGLLVFAHFIIDGTKLILMKETTKRIWFFIDQSAHVLSIYLIYCLYSGYTEFDTSILTEKNFLFVTTVVFLTMPCSYIVKMFIDKWTPNTKTLTGNDDAVETNESLEDAGSYIGIFERLFVFAFVATGNWEAIGFLLAAKSVFRFGDLTKASDRKLTEYILIGTLLSFGIAILAGLVYLFYFPK
jgi:hypothetical protein